MNSDLTRRGFLGAGAVAATGAVSGTVAAEAQAPLSQIHYHFGSKQGMMVALFQHQNDQLLERQRRMFSDPTLSLADQWDQACDYLDEDLASGYVRVLMELWAAGWSDPVVAQAVRDATAGWLAVLTEAAERAAAQHQWLRGLEADEIATLVGSLFVGAEVRLLLGPEDDVPTKRSLRRIGSLIRRLERESGPEEA